MDTLTKFDIVKRNTQEILTEEELKLLLQEKGQKSAYYGTATTGPVHIGYLIPLSKIFDFEKAGIKTKILIADIHGALDDLKSKWEELGLKAEYYKKCMEYAFPWEEKPFFVKGSSFQLEKNYYQDVLKMSTITTINRATRAASEVTRMKEPKISELLYPIFQALDEEYLKVDIQLGGTDQRHIFAFAREYLPQIGYKKRVEIMTPLIASLQGPGTKMSASIPESHIKIYDSEEAIKKKISKAYCPEGIIENNPILQISRFLIFPLEGKMLVERDEKFGGDITFNSYEELEKAFKGKQLHPMDLKNTVAKHLTARFKKAREYFDKNKDMLEKLGKNFLP